MAGFFDLLNQIQTTHPDIWPLISQPGVLQVALDMMAAEQAGQPWTQARIDAALQATPFYQTYNQQQRNWAILSATDPATAATQLTATRQVVDDLQTSLGIQLNQAGGLGSQYVQFINQAVSQGWTPDQIKYHMISGTMLQSSQNVGGDLGNAAAQVKKEFDDYGVPLSDQAVMGWANKLLSGAVDASAITGYAQEQAKSLFPGLSDAISRGISVRQYAAPYLQIAQQELGVDPTTVKLTDPKWMAALNQVDPATGQRVSMNLSDWTTKVRTDTTYGYDKTNQASTQAADFASRLAQMMGATG